jgi:alkanesulfonate monooxygenase SsuD/methylene tetrahydromethanopterin reductase-like flavin-dependent oxidoreductase (luciferase family)
MLYRNPALLAKSLTTIDHLSDGRLEIGLGAGWHEQEFAAYGYEFPPIKQRLDMLEEGTRALRALLTRPRTEFQGSFYHLNNAALYPKPVQAHVPLWIGGRGERRTLRIAARHADGWNVPYIGPEEFAHKCAVLDEWCEQEQRDPKSIERSVNLAFNMASSAKAAAAATERARRQWGAQAEERMAGVLTGGPEAAAEKIARYAAAGASRLNIAIRPPVDWEALEAYVTEVAPRFGA